MFSKNLILKQTDATSKTIVEATTQYLSESVTKKGELRNFKTKDVSRYYAYNLTTCCDVESRWQGTREVPRSTGIEPESIIGNMSKNQPDLHDLLAQKLYFQISVPGSEIWSCRHLELFIPETDRIVTCSTCAGSGQLLCETCKGRGKVKCKTCNFTGYVGTSPNHRTCTACDDHNHAPCSSCDSKGTKMCTRCMGEGELLLYDFFVVSNSGDLCLTNIFPPSKNGAVEQILHERVFHLGKDKATETKNLLQGRMKPFQNADESSLGLPPLPYGKHEDYVVEGETLSVTDCEDLIRLNLFNKTKTNLSDKEKSLLQNIALESADCLVKDLPLGDKQRFIRRYKIILKRKPYYILSAVDQKKYFVTLNPTQITSESSLSWDRTSQLFKKFYYLGGFFGSHRFYLKRYYLGAIHLTSAFWIILFIVGTLKNSDALLWLLTLTGIKLFWLYKENKLIANSRILDVDGNPLISSDDNQSVKKVEFETLPAMTLSSLQKDSFLRIPPE